MNTDKQMSMEELEKVSGGSNSQTMWIITLMSARGYGNFTLEDGSVDYDALEKFFASKGYVFREDPAGPNSFIKDGVAYDSDYMKKLILNRKL